MLESIHLTSFLLAVVAGGNCDFTVEVRIPTQRHEEVGSLLIQGNRVEGAVAFTAQLPANQDRSIEPNDREPSAALPDTSASTPLWLSQFVTSPYYYSNIAKFPKIYDYGFADYPKQYF